MTSRRADYAQQVSDEPLGGRGGNQNIRLVMLYLGRQAVRQAGKTDITPQGSGRVAKPAHVYDVSL